MVENLKIQYISYVRDRTKKNKDTFFFVYSFAFLEPQSEEHLERNMETVFKES